MPKDLLANLILSGLIWLRGEEGNNFTPKFGVSLLRYSSVLVSSPFVAMGVPSSLMKRVFYTPVV